MTMFFNCMSLSIASPPPPTRPTALEVTGNSITIGWNEPECDGGHILSSFTIQYFESDSNPFFPFFGTFLYVRNIDPARRNYTITGLDPDTSYDFRIQAVGVDRRTGSFSVAATIVTLPPGMCTGIISCSVFFFLRYYIGTKLCMENFYHVAIKPLSNHTFCYCGGQHNYTL